MRVIATGLFAALLFAGSAQAQITAPLPDPFYPFPVGQPSNLGIAPFAIGTVPPPVLFAVGNPGLSIVSVAPPMVTPGMPTALMFVPVFGGPPIPAPPLSYCGYTPFPFGFPELPFLPPLAGGFSIPGPPAPGGPVPVPLPPGIPPGIVGFVVVTIGLEMTPVAPPCIWVTDGMRFGTI